MNKNEEEYLFAHLDKRTLKNFSRFCWYKVSDAGFKIRFSTTDKGRYLGWVPMEESFYWKIKKALKLKK